MATVGNEHLVKAFPHEVIVLLKPLEAAAKDDLREQVKRADARMAAVGPERTWPLIHREMAEGLRGLFERRTGYPLADGNEAFAGGDGDVRPLVPIFWLGGDPFALAMVNLRDWNSRPFDMQDRLDVGLGIRNAMRAVNKLNELIEEASRQGKPVQVGSYQVMAATPNWSAGTATCDSGGGNPAGQPISPPYGVRPPNNLPRFQPDDVAKEIRRRLHALPATCPVWKNFLAPGGAAAKPIDPATLGQGVKVAIIDTWPTAKPHDGRSVLQDFRDRLDAIKLDHSRLDEFLNGTVDIDLDGPQFHDLISRNRRLADPHQHFRWRTTLEEPYIQRDHGLFIADIINSIAPKAALRVWRAINDWGLTDAFTIAQAASEAAAWAGDSPLVFNLSLGIGPELYLLKRFLDDPMLPFNDAGRWVETAYNELARSTALDPAELSGSLQHKTFEAIMQLFTMLTSDNVFPVAAAGNDSSRDQERAAPPRIPAAFDGVLSVVASALEEGPVDYSNWGDIDRSGKGTVEAFGGNWAERVDVGRGGEGRGFTLDGDGMIALYTYDMLPPEGNRYGYAQWCGTSFATPVAAGLAAAIWSLAWDGKQVDSTSFPAIKNAASGAAQCDVLTAMVMPEANLPDGKPDLKARRIQLAQR